MRWLYFSICAVLGLALLVAGLLVPIHLRAVDARVIATAGRSGPLLLKQGQALADEGKLGAAEMFSQAARLAGIPGWDNLADATTQLARRNPSAQAWGNDSLTENLFPQSRPSDENLPFTTFIIHGANRDAALSHLGASAAPAVAQLLKTRSLQNTALLPPSSSASGQAFDAAVCVCGLLLDGNHLTPTLASQVNDMALQANRGGGSMPLEGALMDFMSLGERFNWDQLTAFVADIPDTNTLSQLAGDVRVADKNLPVLFAAVQLSGKSAGVAGFLDRFSKSGMEDLCAGLRHGAGGVTELVESGKQYYNPAWERRIAALPPFGALMNAAASACVGQPALALVVKLLLYLLAGFLLGEAVYFARPLDRASLLDNSFLETVHRTGMVPQERPSGAFHHIRVFLFSLAFLFVVLLLSEPFLAQDIQKGNFALRLGPSMVGGRVLPGIADIKQTIMNPTILITLCVFFVLQALLYISCLVKLAEIRRQQVPPRMKLKLLENEDHLFDAGLYLGFVGTIVSLIVFSMGLVKFSLMAAYSSTSFGIIFVVIFKIFHLRPTRRRLLLEAEAQEGTYTPVPATAPAPA
jgi:hypothetical protein